MTKHVLMKHAAPEHIGLLAASMREADRKEVTLFHASAEKAIERSLYKADEAYSFFSIEGEILVMTGVTPYTVLGGVAVPWLLTANGVDRYRKLFLRGTRELVERWRGRYDLLENYVDARYKGALRWAAWAGFEVEPPQRYGYLGLELCRISMKGV